MDAHSIKFMRVAHKRLDGADGLLYLHHFGTGYQELIFQTRQAAQHFLDKENNHADCYKKK